MIDVRHGDSREVIKTLADAIVDSVVCDPPYGLTFMGKHWDREDTPAFSAAFWADVLRVLKPGGHLIAFGGTRTYHRLAVAIEDAGFEIRDQIGWLYGSGFPKSHDVSKTIDAKILHGGSSPKHIKRAIENRPGDRTQTATLPNNGVMSGNRRGGETNHNPATDAARQWQGWGTALKPAWEPIVLARKPLIGTVAANVLAHGTGAMNIDASRIPTTDSLGGGMVSKGRPKVGEGWDRPWMHDPKVTARKKIEAAEKVAQAEALGRWPANVIHDGSEEVVAAFPQSDASGQQLAERGKRPGGFGNIGAQKGDPTPCGPTYADSGSAARFFYSAKADSDDRLGSKHPTVKPVDLMAYLCRLVTPPGGTVLDPFAGSGTTGMACMREGFNAILIEREAEYVADIRRRIAHVKGEDAPLFGGAA